MASGNEEVIDAVELRVAAKSAPKSVGRLGALIRESLSLVWRAGGRIFVLSLLSQIAAAGALAGQVVVVQRLLDAILQIGSGGSAETLTGPVLALAALTACATLLTTAQAYLQRLLGERVARMMWSQVLDVATGVDLQHFESPQFFNALQRVQTSALTRPYQVTQGLMAMLGALAASIGVGVALASISPVLLPLLVLGGIPMLLTSRRESRLEFEFSVAQTPNQRMRTYLALLQTGRDEAKEVRAFGLAGWLRERFDAAYQTYLAELAQHLRRRVSWAATGSIGNALGLALTLVVLVKLIVVGSVTVAGAGAAVVAIRILSTQVQALFSGIQRIFEAGLFLDDVMRFLALEETRRADDRPEAPGSFHRIVAEQISFTYPGSDRPALRGATIRLDAGEVVAIVGENGSGKTTLAKVLAGLYEPQDGTIRWDETDVKTWSSGSVRARISVIFQDFVRYALSGADNIALGDVNAPRDSARIRRAAQATDVDEALVALPQGYDTALSRLFSGGRDLSGGQWQRVAIARGYYRDAPLVILDEPSSALDPRAEADLFASLRRTLNGRSAIFISHRFATVRAADRIYVLAGGRVVEQGSHDELMLMDGQYAELFRLQAAAFLAPHESGGTELDLN